MPRSARTGLRCSGRPIPVRTASVRSCTNQRAEIYVSREKSLAATEAGGSHVRSAGPLGPVAHGSLQVMGQADAMAEEMTHTPTADAQVGYSPGEKNGICAASWSISIEKEGASMSTQAVGPDPPVGVAAKPWADASSEARSVAEYIMLVAAANTRGMVRGSVALLLQSVLPRGKCAPTHKTKTRPLTRALAYLPRRAPTRTLHGHHETEFITVFQDNGLLDKSRSSARLAAGCNSLDAASLWKHTYSTALAFRRPRLFGLGPGLIFGSVTMWSRHCRRCASRLTWLGLPL